MEFIISIVSSIVFIAAHNTGLRTGKRVGNEGEKQRASGGCPLLLVPESEPDLL